VKDRRSILLGNFDTFDNQTKLPSSSSMDIIIRVKKEPSTKLKKAYESFTGLPHLSKNQSRCELRRRNNSKSKLNLLPLPFTTRKLPSLMT
jgi:hypothetical protein